MLKGLMQMLLANRDFGDRSGVYLRCGAKKKSVRIGDADSVERYLAPVSQRTGMGCYGCSHLGCGCWGPEKEVRA